MADVVEDVVLSVVGVVLDVVDDVVGRLVEVEVVVASTHSRYCGSPFGEE